MSLKSNITDNFIVKSPHPQLQIPNTDVWQYLKERFKETPNDIALEDPEEKKAITFKELDKLVEYVASNLQLNGFDPKYPATICMSNCIEYILALLAVWRLHGSVAVVGALLTGGEIKKQLLVLNSQFIFCNSTSMEHVLQGSIGTNVKTIVSKEPHSKCLTFGTLCKRPFRMLTESKDDIRPKKTIAAIPFSSGTTGGSKGVEISHHAMIEQTEVLTHTLSQELIRNGIIIYQPFSHIYGLTLIVFALRSNRKIVIMQHFDLEKFIYLIAKNKIKVLLMVPPIIVQMCSSELLSKYDLSHVKFISSGAAPLSKETELDLKKKLNFPVQISQGYGLTETCSAVMVVPYSHTAPQGSIGWPVSNTEVKVVDENQKNLGPEQRGEICIRCNYLMNGYLKRPDATALVFDKDGWFHTGDVGYYDKNGCFFVVDRIKELIKYKGYQVAPAELESVLLTHPGIDDAGVTSLPDLEAGELPYAWIVRKKGANVSEQDIHHFVNERVAPFKKLRGGIKFVDVIPKSPSGKILRRVIKETSRKPLSKL